MPNPGDPWGCPKCGSFDTIWVETEEIVRKWPAIHSFIGRPEYADRKKARAKVNVTMNQQVVCDDCGFSASFFLEDGGLNLALQSNV